MVDLHCRLGPQERLLIPLIRQSSCQRLVQIQSGRAAQPTSSRAKGAEKDTTPIGAYWTMAPALEITSERGGELSLRFGLPGSPELYEIQENLMPLLYVIYFCNHQCIHACTVLASTVMSLILPLPSCTYIL